MNTLKKVLSVAVLGGMAIATGCSRNGFTREENETIRLAQAFRQCMDTNRGPYTQQDIERAFAEADRAVSTTKEKMPEMSAETIDLLTMALREQSLVKNSCSAKTKTDPDALSDKVAAMIDKYGDEKVTNAISAPAPK